MANEGAAVGALLLGVGGAILFALLYTIIAPSYDNSAYRLPVNGVVFFSFIGFLVLGIGLWLIVQAGKPKSNRTLLRPT